MKLQAGINRARQLANLKGARDYEFYNNVVNWLEELAEFKKNANNDKVFHGMSDTRIYHIWATMKSRCNNATSENYKHYGGRGIKVCDEWNNKNGFWNFYNWAIRHGYNDDLTIDRIDVNGNNEPDNCRWATFKEQAENRREGRKMMITYHNKTMSIKAWADHLGISEYVIRQRLKRDWSIEKALETPIIESQSHKGLSGRKKKQ